MLTKGIKIKDAAPDGYKAILGLEKYICSANINPVYREMIKIRASQINGCAYCIDMHTKRCKRARGIRKKDLCIKCMARIPAVQ